MIIAGAKGFAKEVLEILYRDYELRDFLFYDDINLDKREPFYNDFGIITDRHELKKQLAVYPAFALGTGGPMARYQLSNLFIEFGGDIQTVISKNTVTGSFNTTIGKGCTVMDHVLITNNVTIDDCTLLNSFTHVAHDVQIGKYGDIAPRVSISGYCKVGDFVTIGTAAIILPGVQIGNNVVIGAGSVVKNNIPANSLAIGTPAKVIKKLPELAID
jgi:sugar O-acyltransferase (sialic acid O-acetyltransferase NeuD family)